jgi:hypothetical protein
VKILHKTRLYPGSALMRVAETTPAQEEQTPLNQFASSPNSSVCHQKEITVKIRKWSIFAFHLVYSPDGPSFVNDSSGKFLSQESF